MVEGRSISNTNLKGDFCCNKREIMHINSNQLIMFASKINHKLWAKINLRIRQTIAWASTLWAFAGNKKQSSG